MLREGIRVLSEALMETEVAINGKFRNECLTLEWFRNRLEARGAVHADQLRENVDDAAGSNAARRIITICSSVNRVFFMARSWPGGAPFSQASTVRKSAGASE